MRSFFNPSVPFYLLQEFGSDKGFWNAFADGVEEIEVKEGKLRIRLKE